jgi:hypothetical protein
MTEFDILTLSKRLAAEFQRHGMSDHLARLRRFYSHAQKHRPPKGEWGEGMVLEWLALFRISPLENRYPVRSPNSGCPLCPKDAARIHTQTVFPGGSKHACFTCRAEWLELDCGRK